jgi:hypothetical protein
MNGAKEVAESMRYSDEGRPARRIVSNTGRRAAGLFEGGEDGCSGRNGRGSPAAPQGAKYPLAHLRQQDVEPESMRMVSEVLKALRPFPEARAAVRARFAELFPKVP